MSLQATQADFEGGAPGALYQNPTYNQYPFFQTRIDSLSQRFAPNNQKLAIWGCGWGYLVQLAVTAGYDAFGFDSSAYAINKGKILLPNIASRLFVRDALIAADVTQSKKDAGLKGQTNFPLLVTEDMYSVFSDTEIQTSLPLLRGSSSANLLHLITPGDGGPDCDPRLNWKTITAWRAVFCPPDVVGDCETGLFWNSIGQV